MKRMLILIFIALMAVASCGTYVVRDKSGIEKMKSSGILIRLPENSKILRNEYERTLAQWIAGSKVIKRLEIVTDAPDSLVTIKSEPDRFFQSGDPNRGFFQFGDDGRFLKYKSLGIVNMYLRENRSELKRIINEKNLDGLMIFEVFGVTSTEMQFVDFDLIWLFVDKDLKVLYLDRKSENLETEEFDLGKVRRKLINTVSESFIKTLDSYGFIDN